jgi:hypothetical protein
MVCLESAPRLHDDKDDPLADELDRLMNAAHKRE